MDRPTPGAGPSTALPAAIPTTEIVANAQIAPVPDRSEDSTRTQASRSPTPPLAPPITATMRMPTGQPMPDAHPSTPLWQRNAVQATIHSGAPMIAFLIDDMGLDRPRSEKVTILPPPLTLSYLPYAQHLVAQTTAARNRGHELMVHVPMEPQFAADPGPRALRVDQSLKTLQSSLDWALSRFPGYVGINNHMGSRFTASKTHMTEVMTLLKSRGLLFIDSRTTHDTVGAETARIGGVPYAERDVFLDHAAGLSAIWDAMEEVTRTADSADGDGSVIAIGHPHDDTITALATWIPHLKQAGYQIVPVSAVVKHRMETRRSQTASRP